MHHSLSFHGHLHDLLRLNLKRLLNHGSHFAFTLRQAAFALEGAPQSVCTVLAAHSLWLSEFCIRGFKIQCSALKIPSQSLSAMLYTHSISLCFVYPLHPGLEGLERCAIYASHILLESVACDNCFAPIPQRTAFFLRYRKCCLTGAALFDPPLMWLISASCARGGPPSSPDS